MPTTIDGTSGITAVGGTFSGTVDATTLTEGAVAVPRMVLATAQNTTSGTSIDFTSIPSWAKRITVMLNGVSTSGTSIPIIQLGDSGGIETTGYLGASSICSGAGTTNNNFTTGFGCGGVLAANDLRGCVFISLIDAATNTWVASGTLGASSSAFTVLTGGTKSTSATLDRLRLTTVNGTDTFDAGSVNVMYEG